MIIGASLTGARSSTSTSGPGFSLMAEALGWAGINEVPIVVTLYQRSGPSTGLPTRHGQDDLLFAIHAGHGDFPRIVYASGDTEEGFYDTAKCFNFADVYQIPVIHMMDKFIASTVSTVKRFDSNKITIERGKLLEKIEDAGYKRFTPSQDGVSGTKI
ncbi:2-oxoglutarate/2-oxoacid ferredoxin oxidoreductase, gamma subunit [Candidatus Nitrosotalea sp. FS]|nr:2-oxoglutarate/2-oxoacid ferredoxin oxidoreductase, gamma subunit [Candidatus Nitrosotalea sp. FS]